MKIWVHINVVPRRTQMVEQRINSVIYTSELILCSTIRFVKAYRTFFQDFSMLHVSKQVAIEYVVITVTGLVYTGKVDERRAKFRLKSRTIKIPK